MARRGRAVSIDGLVKQVNRLDAQRKALVARIRRVVDATLSTVEESVQLAGEGTGFVAGVRGPGKAVKRVRRKMSAAARKAISDAQKRRWAKQKAAAK
jgi:hypothetical protein